MMEQYSSILDGASSARFRVAGTCGRPHVRPAARVTARVDRPEGDHTAGVAPHHARLVSDTHRARRRGSCGRHVIDRVPYRMERPMPSLRVTRDSTPDDAGRRHHRRGSSGPDGRTRARARRQAGGGARGEPPRGRPRAHAVRDARRDADRARRRVHPRRRARDDATARRGATRHGARDGRARALGRRRALAAGPDLESNGARVRPDEQEAKDRSIVPGVPRHASGRRSARARPRARRRVRAGVRRRGPRADQRALARRAGKPDRRRGVGASHRERLRGARRAPRARGGRRRPDGGRGAAHRVGRRRRSRDGRAGRHPRGARRHRHPAPSDAAGRHASSGARDPGAAARGEPARDGPRGARVRRGARAILGTCEARAPFVHAPRRPLTVWWTQHPVSAPVLVGWAGGPSAHELARSGALEDVVLAELAHVFRMRRARAESLVESIHWHDWSNDPMVRGAYSYVGVGGVSAPRTLARSVAGRVFMAGEATDAGNGGTVEAALASGERAARAVVRALAE